MKTTVLLSAFIAVFAFPASLLAQAGYAPVFREAEFFLDLYGYFADTVRVYGPCDLEWSDTYFNGSNYEIDTELLLPRLHGETPGFGCISIYRNDLFPSPGKIEFPPPGPDFPAESFFDVFFELQLPDIPGLDALHTDIPLTITSTIYQNPPYFERYEAAQPVTIPVLDPIGTVVGEITSWSETMLPWSPPVAWLECEKSFGSDLAVAHDDTVKFTAGVAGYVEHDLLDPAPCYSMMPLSATFGIREEGDPGPFMPFYTDFDGMGGEIGTEMEIRDGDGWAGYLDISSYDPAGGGYEVEVVFNLGGYIDPAETLDVFVDPTGPKPPLPHFDPDSTANTMPETLLTYATAPTAELLSKIELRAVKLDTDFQRTLEVVRQDDLSSDPATAAVCCGPASAASCLKYWAKNGYPKLEHPGGDTNKPEQSGTDMGKELVGDIDPKGDKHGAQIPAIEAGIKKYIEKRGLTGWSISHHEIKNMSDYARMMREFEKEGEDVIMVVSDTTNRNGKSVRTGHAVTLGSRHSSTENGTVKREIDFMDPKDGTAPANNRYEVGKDSEGYPTTVGYTHTQSPFNDARISGYIKVSPPASGGSGMVAGAADKPVGAPAAGDWILLDSVPGKGGGLTDTLWWDTTGFEPGLYLTEVRAEDISGVTGSTLRFVNIMDPSTSAEGGVIPSATRLVSAWPNPFNPSTTIEFETAARSKVDLAIYDVSGRLVKRLIEGERVEPGRHRTSWDGTSEAGGRVSSGVYFCVLETPGGGTASKLVLIR